MADIDDLLAEIENATVLPKEKKVKQKQEVKVEVEENTDDKAECKKKRKRKQKQAEKEEDSIEEPQDWLSKVKLESLYIPLFQDNSHLRLIDDWNVDKKKYDPVELTPVSKQFSGVYPLGEEMEYNSGTSRSAAAEKREAELQSIKYNDIRQAAECHRQVRRVVQNKLKPGANLTEIVHDIENLNRFFVEKNKLKAGIGFPTGVSLNECAAHYSPNPEDSPIVLNYDDILKVDYGTHVNGLIVDCAFTVAFNPDYDPLLMATKDATNTAIKAAGIDARLSEIGEIIQEVIESYEVTIKGKVFI